MTDATYPLWSDNPSSRDLVGFNAISSPVVDAIGRARLDPVSVGLFGPWGSGKSTLLDLVEADLAGRADVVVVRVQPWEYDPAIDPKAAIIGDILQKLEGADLGGQAADLKSRLAGLAKKVRWTKAVSLVARSALTVSLPNWEEVEGLFTPDDPGTPSEPTLAGFRDDFAKATADADYLARVVVLVDDVDRCLPEVAIGVLEAIKLFLSVPKMAFVIAADEEAVVEAIATRFRATPAGEAMARQYLEKIVQIPVRLPSLGLGDTEAYLSLLLLDHRFVGDTEQFEKVVAHCAGRRAGGSERPIADLDDATVPQPARTDLALARMLAPVLYEALDGNPRRLKRFLNAFWIRSAIAAARSIKLDEAVLAKLMVLEELHPKAFQQVLAWASDGTLPRRLAELEGAEQQADAGEHSGTLVEWARTGPRLTETEVGPYLRLAASLTRTPAGASTIRDDLRELLLALTGDAEGARVAAQRDAAGLPVDDRRVLVQHIFDALMGDPGRQQVLAESLAELAYTDDVVASDVAGFLQQFDVNRVEPGMPVFLIRTGAKVPSALRELVESWVQSGQLPDDTAQAAAGQLRPPKSGRS
jgi:hypothetical protein